VTVVSSEIIIFCEGKQTSLDYKLLNQVVENVIKKTTIVPVGSKFTFSPFIQGYFSQQSNKSGDINQKYIMFRDRDFDAKPTTDISLIPFQSMLLTHRACVENYLLNDELIHNYWHIKYMEKQENPSSTWRYGDSPGIEAISAWIREAAISLQDYQTVRWALADLLQSSTTRHQLKTTWTGGSGKLPSPLTLQDCKSQALILIKQFQQAVETVTQERLEESIAKYQQQFAQEQFWKQKQYLIWFHGKDIQKAMHKNKPKYIPIKTKKGPDFFDWASDQLDINHYPDLTELKNRISSL